MDAVQQAVAVGRRCAPRLNGKSLGGQRTMRAATLQWADKVAPIAIESRAELESRLRDVARQSVSLPVLAVLSMNDGSSAFIGLGREESVVFLHGRPGPDGLTDEWIPVVDDT